MDEARTTVGEISAEPRPSDLHVQFEQVTVALQQLRQTQQSMLDMESRMADMTRECSTILDRWAKNDEKHATAVVELHNRLSEWNDIERRLLSESSSRVHQFERSLQHEWTTIRQTHEQPVKDLDAQAARIAETCLTAVDEALRGFERAELRLTTIEQELQREMSALSREVREAVAELRQNAPQVGPRQPWALDNVVRLHHELRSHEGGSDTPAAGPSLVGAGSTFGLSSGATARAPVPEPSEAPVSGRDDDPGQGRALVRDRDPAQPLTPPAISQAAEESTRWASWRSAPVIAAVVTAAMLGLFALYLQAQVRSSLRDAATRAEAAERGASESQALARQEMEAARRASDDRLAVAQHAAEEARRFATLLAAPDLRRFDLAGQAGRASGQVLWSRAQGVAFNSTTLRPAAAGRAYQLWLRTRDKAVNVGIVPADPGGRTSVIFETPANLPRPVVQAVVTMETAGGSPEPSNDVFLRSPAPAPVAPIP